MEKNLEQENRNEVSEEVKLHDTELQTTADRTQESEEVKTQGAGTEPQKDFVPREGNIQTENEVSTDEVDQIDGDSCDDLDDMLDKFLPNPDTDKLFDAKTNTQANSKPNPQANTEAIKNNEFEKQLEAEMAEFFNNMKTTPDLAAGFENLLRNFEGAQSKGEESRSQSSSSIPDKSKIKSGTKSVTTGLEESFKDAINKTMERVAASGEQATAAAASENPENAESMLLDILKATQSPEFDDFSNELLEMMEQLTNKEILYEPMKELDNKYPEWMEKHSGEVEKADLERYKQQQVYVSEIVKRFESDGYEDGSAVDKEYIVERMQKMQAIGAPPSALVGGLSAAQEALCAPEEGCPMS